MSEPSSILRTFLPAGVSSDMFYIFAAGLVAVACVVAVSRQFVRRDSMAGRIRSVQRRRHELVSEINSPKKRKKPEQSVNFMRAVAVKLQLVKKFQLEKAEGLLVHANFRSKDAIWIFAFFTMISPIILFGLGVAAMKMLQTENADMSQQWMGYFCPLAGLYLGLNTPWIVVRYLRNKRFLAIQRSLSDMLDLMTVCAEAGLSLPAALERVSRELGLAYPELAEELAMTSIEIGFLPDRNKALANLSERCGLKEMRGIVTVLIQTEKYGTPIAQALRVLSSEFRQQRMMRAEAKAARLPALMTVPMIVFILPTLFIVIMSPAAISIINNLKASDERPAN